MPKPYRIMQFTYFKNEYIHMSDNSFRSIAKGNIFYVTDEEQIRKLMNFVMKGE